MAVYGSTLACVLIGTDFAMQPRHLFALAALVAVGASAATELFDKHSMATPPAAHQTMLFGSLVDDRGSGQLSLVTVAPTGDRHLRVYVNEGGEWTPRHEVALAKDVRYFDVARVGGRDRLVVRRPDGFHWIDPGTGETHPLVDVASRFHASPDAGIPQLDVVRDLNGDGRDDLAGPAVDGFWIALQSHDGSFASAAKLGPAEPFREATAYGDERTYGQVGVTAQNTPWYLSRMHQLDFDRDGRTDLAFWNDDHFLLYRQDASGNFASSAEAFTTDVAFDFDGAYGLAFQFGDANVASLLLGFRKRVEHRILHGFRDLDGDGIGDMVVLSLAGRSPLRLRGRYEVHFGRPVPNGTAFVPEPDTTADAPRRSGGLMPWGYAAQHFLDFDGDGGGDMAMAAVNTGLTGMFRAMVGNSVAMELALYRLQDRRYPAKPDARRKLSKPFAPWDRRGPLFPTVLVGDVNGDGRSDLLTGDRWDELSVFLGRAGPDPLETEAAKVQVSIPSDERHARLADLDRDGKQDVVIAHPSRTEKGRITILMAR